MRQLHDYRRKEGRVESARHCGPGGQQPSPDKNKAALKDLGDLPIRLLSDHKFESARRFHSYDDFEEMELHSTILIDRKSRVTGPERAEIPFATRISW